MWTEANANKRVSTGAEEVLWLRNIEDCKVQCYLKKTCVLITWKDGKCQHLPKTSTPTWESSADTRTYELKGDTECEGMICESRKQHLIGT